MFYSGILFGFSFFITSIYWITNSIFVFDSSLAYLSPFPLIILPLILGIFYGLMQLINTFFWSLNISRIFFFSAFWVFFEIIRSTLLIGFPWNLVAYSWSWSISFIQSLSLFGVFGLGLISIFCSVGIFSLNLKKANIFLCIFSRSQNKAKIKGINFIKKHEKTTKEKKGGIISKENFIHISNLKILDKPEKKIKSGDKK